MNKQTIHGNVSVLKHLKKKSAEEYEDRSDEPLLSRFHPASPSAMMNDQSTESSRTQMFRFDDDVDLNEKIPPRTALCNQSAKHVLTQSHPVNEVKYSSRWPDAYEKDTSDELKQEKDINQHPWKNKNVDLPYPPVQTTMPVTSEMSQAYVQEFHPTSDRDPVFAILRELFIYSFDDYYKQIETKLRLNSEKSLIQWLDETFDDEQNSILSGKYRCFILYGNMGQSLKENIIGFLTLQEEASGSVYIAQVAIRRKYKRRGYGYQLLQHLRQIYPTKTSYWGLCRRANEPAVRFYLQLGAVFMDTDDDATKYGYNPLLYAGFKFVDVPSIVAPPVLPDPQRPKTKPNNAVQQSVTSTNMAQPSPNLQPKNRTRKGEKPAKEGRKKAVGCCTVS